MIRTILVLAVFVTGLWLFHSASVYEGVLAARGQGDWSKLIEDVPFMLRFAGGLLLTAGGALSFAWKWIGFVPVLLGTACYVLLSGAMIAMGTDISLWQADAALTGGLILLCAGLFVTRVR